MKNHQSSENLNKKDIMRKNSSKIISQIKKQVNIQRNHSECETNLKLKNALKDLNNISLLEKNKSKD